MATVITYLGHKIDEHGIHATKEHVEALRKMPTPTNKKELQSFLIFFQGLSHNYNPCVHCYDALVKQDTKWIWSVQNDYVFTKLKSALTSKDTLMHYNADLPLVLITDASDHGVGAVLMLQLPD